MNERQAKQYRMLMRLKEFGAAYANRFPEDAPAHKAFAAIEEALNQLETFAVQRLAARRQDVRARALAREALVKMLEAISRAARLLKAEDPDFPHTFLMPVQESAETLLMTARLFLEQAEPLAARFSEHSMGKTFPENFKRVLTRYEEAIEGRERGKGLNKATLKRLEEAITIGLSAARRLDIIVGQELANDPAAVVDWRRSRRIGYRVSKAEPPATVITPVFAPAAPSPQPAFAAAKSIDAGTDVVDALAASSTAVPDVAALTVPVDLDVGDLTDVIAEPSFPDAAPTVAAETEDEDAA